MKTRIIFCFFFLVLMITNGNAYEKGPVAVSPGSESGVAVVGQSCPTFSWSAVQGAGAYRIMVFKAVSSEVLAYEEMDSKGYAVINKEIRGPALSWTPSEDERLSNGEAYVWYVQAVDAYGGAIWSEGRMFIVAVAERLAGMEEKVKVRDRLREYGVSEEAIPDVLKGFKPGVDTQESGYKTPNQIVIQGTEGYNNTFYGLNAGANNTGGIYNSFFGVRAGYNHTSGHCNSFFGHYAGHLNTGGGSNIFIGYYTGASNTTAWHNTFIGVLAGSSNTTGNKNTFIGSYAGTSNRTGYYNTFIGYKAGQSNNTGHHNIFIGYEAGFSNTTGEGNTFSGYKAGYNNTTGGGNTFSGFEAGHKNTTGSGNTFSGVKAGHKNTTGEFNACFGYAAGYKNKTGKLNTFIGHYAGSNNTNGSNNVFLGQRAGYYETRSDRLYIDSSDTRSPLIYGRFDTDIVAINGKLGVGKNPKKLIDTKGGAYCNGRTWINASSREYKENIESLDADEAMDALDGLNPVKFNYKRDKEEEHVGFIAEDVPDIVATKERKGLSVMDVVAVLTKVVQEQQKAMQEQQKAISELKEMIAELKKEKQDK